MSPEDKAQLPDMNKMREMVLHCRGTLMLMYDDLLPSNPDRARAYLQAVLPTISREGFEALFVGKKVSAGLKKQAKRMWKNYATTETIYASLLSGEFPELSLLQHHTRNISRSMAMSDDERSKFEVVYRKCSMGYCNKVGTLACEKCKSARYCSVECQSAHWPIHKKSCKLIRKAAKKPTP
jgi:hypothetical protein